MVFVYCNLCNRKLFWAKKKKSAINICSTCKEKIQKKHSKNTRKYKPKNEGKSWYSLKYAFSYVYDTKTNKKLGVKVRTKKGKIVNYIPINQYYRK